MSDWRVSISTAGLAGGVGRGQDRYVALESAVVVLDGASSFRPEIPPADAYVDALAAELADRLDQDRSLTDILADAISVVVRRMSLAPGRSPSSTVLLLRERDDAVQTLVLADSTILVHTTDDVSHRISDPRLDTVDHQTRQRFRARLAAGSGFDDEHRELLRGLQMRELPVRNRDGGYWVAEADPAAAYSAITTTFPAAAVDWCVLATDGAQVPIDHLGIPWATIAAMNDIELATQLAELDQWEREQDPTAILLPRSKPHDDKTLVAIRRRG